MQELNSDLLTNLVRLMARTYRQNLKPDEAATYREWCKGIPEAELESVFREAMEASPEFMPTGPGISAIWKRRAPKVDALEADREWKRIVDHVDRELMAYEHKAPKDLTPAGDYALRQIGGIEAVYNLMLENREDDLRWLGKTFREAYGRYAETGGLKAIGRDEARRLLDQAKAWQKELPQGDPQ